MKVKYYITFRSINGAIHSTIITGNPREWIENNPLISEVISLRTEGEPSTQTLTKLANKAGVNLSCRRPANDVTTYLISSPEDKATAWKYAEDMQETLKAIIASKGE